jgi:hypothetical protein
MASGCQRVLIGRRRRPRNSSASVFTVGIAAIKRDCCAIRGNKAFDDGTGGSAVRSAEGASRRPGLTAPGRSSVGLVARQFLRKGLPHSLMIYILRLRSQGLATRC